MTSDRRQYLKQAIDAHKRERLAAAKGADFGTCRQCGCDLATYLTGCNACANRKHNRKRQTDPEYRAKQTRKSRERRLARQRARAKKVSSLSHTVSDR